MYQQFTREIIHLHIFCISSFCFLTPGRSYFPFLRDSNFYRVTGSDLPWHTLLWRSTCSRCWSIIKVFNQCHQQHVKMLSSLFNTEGKQEDVNVIVRHIPLEMALTKWMLWGFLSRNNRLSHMALLQLILMGGKPRVPLWALFQTLTVTWVEPPLTQYIQWSQL